MIVDTLSGSGRYDALHPQFKKAFDYAVARMDTLAPGNTPSTETICIS
ncbi:MAG: hypothetical protein ACLUEV_06945 [Alistipes sp.]